MNTLYFTLLIAREDKYSPDPVDMKKLTAHQDCHSGIPGLAMEWRGSRYLIHF